MWIQEKFEFFVSAFSPVFLTSVFFPNPKSQRDSWIMQSIKVCRHYVDIYVYQNIWPMSKYRRFNSCLKNTVYVTEDSQCTYVSTDLSAHMLSILVFTSFSVLRWIFLTLRACLFEAVIGVFVTPALEVNVSLNTLL